MATEEPGFNRFNPYFRKLIETYDREAFPKGAPKNFENKVGAAYNDFFKRPYVCALMADVISGRWKLGTTQLLLSTRLGCYDRTWVSHSLRKGKLSLDLYMRLRCCPTRPDDWEPVIEDLQGEMGRSAFIGVSQFLAQFISNRPLLVPETFDELDYELICEIIAKWEFWLELRIAGKAANMARQIVANVAADQNRNVIPEWYVAEKREEVKARISRLKSDASAASQYLTRLEQNWVDVIAKAYDELARVKWRHK